MIYFSFIIFEEFLLSHFMVRKKKDFPILLQITVKMFYGTAFVLVISVKVFDRYRFHTLLIFFNEGGNLK